MIDGERLLGTFLDLVRIPSPSGQEAAVAEAIERHLAALGLGVQSDADGNLLARVNGEGEPLLLTAHMDTVVPCEGVTPVVKDGIVYSDGTTILGGDDKSGVAVILEVVRVLREQALRHRPLELLFTVREEVGLEGAKAFDTHLLKARMGVGLDAGGEQGTMVVNAPSQDSLRVQVHGRPAHAGVNPEDGVNAIRAAAEAIAAMPLGRIDAETTSNIGVINGGRATNIVPDLVSIQGEARSRDREKLAAQTQAMVAALERSAQANGATLEMQIRREYEGYHMTEDTPVVKLVGDAMRSLGVTPLLKPTGGGSDANVFNAAGVQVVQISTGMAAVHTREEFIKVDDMLSAARIVLACARI
ncbi:MAG: M20/M25/M40 family metallo-hydrolase [Anaerolineae bacterium]